MYEDFSGVLHDDRGYFINNESKYMLHDLIPMGAFVSYDEYLCFVLYRHKNKRPKYI
jgi:hypothetical protein